MERALPSVAVREMELYCRRDRLEVAQDVRWTRLSRHSKVLTFQYDLSNFSVDEVRDGSGS